jgi:hypothetical protein
MKFLTSTALVLSLISSPSLFAADSMFGLTLNGDLNPDLIVKSNDLYVLNLKPELSGYKVNPTNPSPDFQNYYVGMKDNKIKQITAIGYENVGAIDSDKLESGEPNELLDVQLLKYQTVKEELTSKFGEFTENQSKYAYFPNSTLLGNDFYITLGTALSANDNNDINHSYNIRLDMGTK